jgi:AI-2 transport protein TqsA
MSEQSGLAVNHLLSVAAAVIIIAGIKAAADMLVPFLFAIFVAIISAPPLHWLVRRGIPEVAAVLLLMLLFLLAGGGLTLFLGGTVNAFYQDIPVYETRITGMTSGLVDWVRLQGVDVPDNVIAEYFNPGMILGLVGSVFNGLGGVLTNALLIMFTVIFILLEASGMPAKLKRAFGEQTSTFDHFGRFSELVQRYLAIKTLVSLGTGVSIGLALWVIGVDYAPVWALIAFLLNYIPNIGSMIAAVPAVLVAMVQLGVGEAVATIVVFVVVNTLFGNVVEPRMMGRSLGLSTLVVFLSLVFWGWVLGPVGMLLSIPLTMVVKIALEVRPRTRWMATLLDH